MPDGRLALLVLLVQMVQNRVGQIILSAMINNLASHPLNDLLRIIRLFDVLTIESENQRVAVVLCIDAYGILNFQVDLLVKFRFPTELIPLSNLAEGFQLSFSVESRGLHVGDTPVRVRLVCAGLKFFADLLQLID